MFAMNKSFLTGLSVGIIVASAILLMFLPIERQKFNLDGTSLKVILKAHILAAGAFTETVGEAELPAPTTQFLESYNVELVEEGNRYTVRYVPIDTRVKGGGYVVELEQSDGQISLTSFGIER